MATRKQVQASKRNQVESDPGERDFTDRENAHRSVNASFLKFTDIDLLPNRDQLVHEVENLIKKHGNKGDEISMTTDEKNHTITYRMGEKNLALSIARHIENSFKGYKPTVDIHNPERNVFYNITVSFAGPNQVNQK